MSRARNLAQVGRATEILLEGPAPKSANMWTGRTPDFRPVLIPMNGHVVGDLVRVRLRELQGFTFFGDVLP
jgi:tRNA A37 methylthiotransferase MiaB